MEKIPAFMFSLISFKIKQVSFSKSVISTPNKKAGFEWGQKKANKNACIWEGGLLTAELCDCFRLISQSIDRLYEFN